MVALCNYPFTWMLVINWVIGEGQIVSQLDGWINMEFQALEDLESIAINYKSLDVVRGEVTLDILLDSLHYAKSSLT